MLTSLKFLEHRDIASVGSKQPRNAICLVRLLCDQHVQLRQVLQARPPVYITSGTYIMILNQKISLYIEINLF